jgi:hypothetical protein
MSALEVAEPMVGFRTWRVVDGRLWSPYIPRSWDERIMRAECYRGPGALIQVDAVDHPADDVPHPDCGCGLYAYHAPPSRFSAVDHRGVVGIVTASGRLEPHTDGVRAEIARIEALAVSAQWSERQRWAVFELADKLGVDLVDDAELETVAARYGPAPSGSAGSPFVGRGVAAIRRFVGLARN